ncbi:hypothetical protein DFH07DRAFT_962139 [Mycena maculata]|uniref:Uncharacterized protein n=1 Tax=Mycena maculata TaxID=230809 RepID=A0AAD7IQT2_9AGAR|nr:hypothetical protein DFH07DRAFT_962139 [Mycena maculata]
MSTYTDAPGGESSSSYVDACRPRERPLHDREREPRYPRAGSGATCSGFNSERGGPRERDVPPYQYDVCKPPPPDTHSWYRDAPPHVRYSNSTSTSTLTQSQGHPRDRELPVHREHECEPPMQREHELPTHHNQAPPPHSTMLSAPRTSQNRSDSRSASPPGARKRDKMCFASAEVGVVVVAFGLVDRSAVDTFVPDEFLDDSKEPAKPEKEYEPERPKDHPMRENEEERDCRKRQPLPPQTVIYQQEGKHSKPAPLPPSTMPPIFAWFPPLGPKDLMLPPVLRLPSGPRNPRPAQLQLDTNDVPHPRDLASPTHVTGCSCWAGGTDLRGVEHVCQP